MSQQLHTWRVTMPLSWKYIPRWSRGGHPPIMTLSSPDRTWRAFTSKKVIR